MAFSSSSSSSPKDKAQTKSALSNTSSTEALIVEGKEHAMSALDKTSSTKVLVVEYRASKPALIKDNCTEMKMSEVYKLLENNPTVRLTCKPMSKDQIKGGRIDIYGKDFWYPHEQEERKGIPSGELHIMQAKVPFSMRVRSVLGSDTRNELFILSDDRSEKAAAEEVVKN